jgi:hypothetical protein
MSALRDRVLNSSLDELVVAAERGEIDPDELWREVLGSLDRSVDLLKEASGARQPAASSDWYAALTKRQDRIDAIIARWRADLNTAGALPPHRVGSERA